MSCPQELAEASPTAYTFEHIDPASELDRDLLQALTLDPSRIDDDWLVELDQVMDEGSKPLDASRTRVLTLGQRNDILHARRHYEEKLGIPHPDHPLHETYKEIGRNHRRFGPMPSTMFNSLRGLVIIAGNVEGAIDLVGRSPTLMIASRRNVRLNHVFMQYVAARLGWRGNVADLITQRPDVLLTSRKKLTALGWIAARHATPELQDMTAAEVASAIDRRTVEDHIFAILQYKAAYRFGRTYCRNKPDWPARARREFIYQALAEPENVERIGQKAVYAYFRHRPPSIEAQRRYPYLGSFTPPAKRAPALPNLSGEELPRVITGEEPWLEEIIPNQGPAARKGWCLSANRHIALGSASLSHLPYRELEYEAILQERHEFFKCFRWVDPKTPIGRAFGRFSLTHERLVIPRDVVDILNLLTEYEVTPVVPVAAACFPIFQLRRELLRTKLDTIVEEGFKVNEVLQDTVAILMRSVPSMRVHLEKRRQREARRAAQISARMV